MLQSRARDHRRWNCLNSPLDIVRKDTRVGILLLIVVLGIAARIWISRPTWMHWDENYYLDIAQNYALRGGLTPFMWRIDDLDIIAGSGSGYGIIALALWQQFVGNSLVGGRLLMIAAGLASAVVMYQTAQLWWDSQAAGIAALVVGLVTASSLYTLVLRMDAIGILAYTFVLLMHIQAVRSGRKWLHFAVGVTVIATTDNAGPGRRAGDHGGTSSEF